MNLSGCIKSKTITKVLDKFIDRGLELWNNKEITTTLTAPGTVRTAVGRDKHSKILKSKKTERCSTGSQCNFLSTGVILAYLLVFDRILAALFWMHCNLQR